MAAYTRCYFRRLATKPENAAALRLDCIKIGSAAVCDGGLESKLTCFASPELIPVLGSQPADDVSHKPGGRLPLLSARPAVTPATLKRAATNFAAW